jgi:hypothetical protein
MKKTNRTHGARWLAKLIGLGQIVIGAAVVGAALWMLITFPVWWGDAPRIPLPVDVGILAESDFLALESTDTPFRTWELGLMRGELEVTFASPWAQWAIVFLGLQEFVLVFLILHFLRKIVGSISAGEAFSAVNAGRLRWVGGLLILEAIFGPGAAVIVSKVALHGLDFTGGELTVNWFRDFGEGGFVSGWIILVLSEVFRQGAEMKREQSLTI